ncbi:MAG: MraY family glycosyltransferase [Thermoanaerobaculia bacterium]
MNPPDLAGGAAPAFAAALVAATVLTPLARDFARRRGFVAQPKDDRWHRAPTALLGGPVLVLASGASFLAVRRDADPGLLVSWLLGAVLLSLVGLVDDLRELRPATKLVAQACAALLPIQAGLTVPGLPQALSLPIALLWIVGITNAFNLLDNMDGLAGGVAAIAGAFLVARGAGESDVPVAAAAVCGAALGFLLFNFNPASIFMGDSGSLFLGYSLGTLSLLDVGVRPLGGLPILAVPLLVLAVPVFDTTLVTVTRLLHGRSPSRGGRDHSSHRLVALGLSERHAVVLLWLLSALTGAISLLVFRLRASTVGLVVLGVVLGMLLLGACLGRVKVYGGETAAVRRAPGRADGPDGPARE